jgi:hypothetical protein
VKSARAKGMARKIKRGVGAEKPNQRRGRQQHLAIAAKCIGIFSGYWQPGK